MRAFMALLAAVAVLVQSSTAGSHPKQIGLHVQPALGYRVILPFNEEFCGQAGKSVCAGRSPLALDLGLSYGLTSAVEILVEGRLGLETDFGSTPSAARLRTVALAPGVKLYLDDSGRSKFFSTLQALVDITEHAAGNDYGVRNVNGFLVDVNHWFGVYAHAGMTIGFVRWLRFEIEGGIGVQARFP